MTREETLDWLYRLRSQIYVYMPEDWLIPMNDALDMVIKALEQEPCEDAISRQAVIDEMYKRKANGDAITAGFIKNLKPVTPQPKTGHWIVHEKPNGIRYLECSCCNIWYLNEHLLRNSYCPNCGRSMVEPQERSDKV